MGAIASQITSLAIVYSTVYSDADQSKHQSSASLAFVREIHRGPVNFPHKWPVTRKMFPFDDVIMSCVQFGYEIQGLWCWHYCYKYWYGDCSCYCHLMIYNTMVQSRSLGVDKYYHTALYNGCNYLSILGLKSNHVGKMGHCSWI